MDNVNNVTNIPRSRSNEAVLIVDMISDFSFEGGEQMFDRALSAAENVAELKRRADDVGVPVVFVNDNYGKWNEDFGTYVKNTMEASNRGRQMVEALQPGNDDLYVVKPQRSGFYATPLGVLLLSMDVSKVIVTGVTTDICVLFTAHDAYMRGYHVEVPADCSATIEPKHHDQALRYLERVADAETRNGKDIEFAIGGEPWGQNATRFVSTDVPDMHISDP